MVSVVEPRLAVPTWRSLCWLPDSELAKLDVALVNLAVAVGLPGWERIDPVLCLRTLDAWADHVRGYTHLALPSFRGNPAAHGNSESYFRVLCLVTVLQRDLGVRYNPAKIPLDVPFHTGDTFIHGVVQGDGGTCATMPVVYAAVGRRLGYPIKLVSVQGRKSPGHQFARWEDADGERFNIEATNKGLNCPPDDYYRERHGVDPELERWGSLLRSKTPRMELAGFVMERAEVCHEAGDRRGSVEGYAWACSLVPENVLYRETLRGRMNEWTRWHNAQKPPGFPAEIMIGPPPRRMFPETLPLEFERDILGLMATENILNDPEWSGAWERMRRGEWRGKAPTGITVDYRQDGSSEVSLWFDRP